MCAAYAPHSDLVYRRIHMKKPRSTSGPIFCKRTARAMSTGGLSILYATQLFIHVLLCCSCCCCTHMYILPSQHFTSVIVRAPSILCYPGCMLIHRRYRIRLQRRKLFIMVCLSVSLHAVSISQADWHFDYQVADSILKDYITATGLV